jgi:hypothetical protein
MTGVLAQYASLDETRQAIESLREAGHLDLQVYSPVPSEELEEAMDIHSSPVGLWALIGGITGCITGLLITAGTSLAYPIVTQGKPIVSIPPFIVVMFELTILLTGIFALMAMLIHARKPAFRLAESYRTSFSVDRWGVFVPSRGSEQSRVETIVREAGAVDVEVEVHR